VQVMIDEEVDLGTSQPKEVIKGEMDLILSTKERQNTTVIDRRLYLGNT
jgi:hypothetical protein